MRGQILLSLPYFYQDQWKEHIREHCAHQQSDRSGEHIN